MALKWFDIASKERRWYRKQIINTYIQDINTLQDKYVQIKKKTNRAQTQFDIYKEKYLEERQLIKQEARLCSTFKRTKYEKFIQLNHDKIKKNKDIFEKNIILDQLKNMNINQKYHLKDISNQEQIKHAITNGISKKDLKALKKHLYYATIDSNFSKYEQQVEQINQHKQLQLKMLMKNKVCFKRDIKKESFAKSLVNQCIVMKNDFLKQYRYVQQVIKRFVKLYNHDFPHAVAKNCLSGLNYLINYTYKTQSKVNSLLKHNSKTKELNNLNAFLIKQEKVINKQRTTFANYLNKV